MNQSHNQVMVNNGGYGGYATWHPVVNNSGFRMKNNKNWKMNKRNVINNNNHLNNNKSNVKEMQQQNRLKPRRFAMKKYSKSVPFAPRNTTSFIIRAKKSGGIVSLDSPCAVTPAVLPTPVFSPSSEVLGDMAKEEWGVDGYGSMKGLIRRRNDDDDVDEGVTDVERFEMVYPSNGGKRSILENRVDDHDGYIARLEEDNLVLKERLFNMEREFGNLRTRLQSLEIKKHNDNENDCGSNDNDNNDENECSVHNDDHKMEDEDNATVEAKDRKLNGMVVNVDSSDIKIELTETIDDVVGEMGFVLVGTSNADSAN